MVEKLVQHVEQMTDHDFNITCSFVELYQDKLYDLLSDKPSREQYKVDRRENDGKTVITTLTEMTV